MVVVWTVRRVDRRAYKSKRDPKQSTSMMAMVVERRRVKGVAMRRNHSVADGGGVCDSIHKTLRGGHRN